MVESTRQLQSRDPFERFDEAINDPRLYQTYQYGEAHQYGRPDEYSRPDTAHADSLALEPVPLFLSNYDDEPDPQAAEYSFARGKRKQTRSSRMLKGMLAVVAAAGIAALFSIDSTRAVIVSAKASLAGGAPLQFGAAQPETAQPPQAQANAGQPAAPAAQPPGRVQPAALASAAPTRDEITAAYQSALKSRVVAIEPAAPPAPAAAARRMDPDELATLLKRAKGMLAIGDITSARLLLERAADAQEAEAALMLAVTYDPQVLGAQDMRSITADPAAARSWYQKAAQLGSTDAMRRLSQFQN